MFDDRCGVASDSANYPLIWRCPWKDALSWEAFPTIRALPPGPPFRPSYFPSFDIWYSPSPPITLYTYCQPSRNHGHSPLWYHSSIKHHIKQIITWNANLWSYFFLLFRKSIEGLMWLAVDTYINLHWNCEISLRRSVISYRSFIDLNC